MAAIVGAIGSAVGAVAGAMKDTMDLPTGEWVDQAAVVDAPCLITCLCPICSCIPVYMTWGKLMSEEALKWTLMVVLGYIVGSVGMLLFLILLFVPGLEFLSSAGSCCPWIGCVIGLVQQRKALGTWMNIPEEQLADPKAMACACCCTCFQLSAEQQSVDKWISSTMLCQAPLKAAHEAKKKLDGALDSAGA